MLHVTLYDNSPLIFMRMFLRLSGLFTASALMLGVASAALFSDTAGVKYEIAIGDLKAFGIVRGYYDGTFLPNNTVNRGELIKTLMFAKYKNQIPTSGTCFSDITDPNIYYAGPACLAKEIGIVQGYSDGTFKAGNSVNLAEALKMAAVTFQIDLPHVTGPWYSTYVKAARDRHILVDLLDTPAHLLTRQEMAELIDRLIIGTGSISSSSSSSSSSSTSSSSSSVSSSVTIRHAIMNIVQQTSPVVTGVAAGKKDVSLLKFTAVADRQDVLLTSVTFKALQGNLIVAQHYRLMMDTDDNGTYETTVATANPSNGSVLQFSNFENGGAHLVQLQTASFQVVADLIPSYSSASFKIGFATDVPAYVTAQGIEDGRGLDNIETGRASIPAMELKFRSVIMAICLLPM